MKGDLKWKIPLFCVCTALALWFLFPLKQAIHLGLDLQGGLHLVLEVQTAEVVERELVRTKDSLIQELKKAQLNYTEIVRGEAVETLKITAPTPDDLTKIADYIAKEFLNLEKKGAVTANDTTFTVGFRADVVKYWKNNAVQQALTTINNRVNELGLTEPVIQQQGDNRIIVELAGEKDPQRAIDLIGRTAELRFQLVRSVAATQEALLKNNKPPEGAEILSAVPSERTGGARFYLLEKESKVTGADLQDARVSKDELGMPAVSFEFDKDGARRFGTLTEQSIGKQLAIVLDNIVQSAPVIRSKITNQGQITGRFTQQEAADLSIVLRAGALPAAVKILQNITVGPSLGEDSIRAGEKATLIGTIGVFVFMLLVYKGSGIIANLALCFNGLFILGTLAYFKATLTLPGLAGFALTIAMAVDSNILIFERIKEELKVGKTLRSAVENGFSRAMLAIIDSNLTTLMAGIILFQFGEGAVRGFAVTLSIGIIFTLFTAVTLSKVIFDLLLQYGNIKRLSI